MSVLKSLTLGSAAGLVALAGAQAADLPVKTKAIEYVKICNLYGAGFYFIPGTDTCLRIGGAIRIDTAFNGAVYDAPFWLGGANGAGSFNRNYFSTRERVNLFVDTRTATDYGLLRTYANLQLDFTQGRDNIAGGFGATDFAFIQFAGFTFGKAVSMFDPQWALGKPFISNGFMTGSNNTTGIPMLAYTATLGNGLSATISLEDAQPYRSAGVINTAVTFLGPFGSNGTSGPTYGTVANSFVGNAQGGDHVPDIVGNLRIDQAWGSAHIAAAAHEVHGTYYTAANSDTGHPSSTWGYAISGAFELKNLPTGTGDSLKVEASFANGAAKYVFGGTIDQLGAGRFAIANGNGIAFGYILDGVYTGTNAANGTGISKTDAWEVSAYYEHYWNPAWRTSVFGSYSQISYGSGANAALLAAFNAPVPPPNSVAAGSALAGTFSLGFAQIGTRTAWSPVRNLTLSAEFTYTRLDQNLSGTVNVTGVPGYAGATTFNVRDQNRYNGAVQALRSF
ncbi:porin [Bradyrhizobium prioriisuperbiae]|uniref:porin n=1 Tax=Bradyrhizobium prioriisuperbiae TaxID=2854389 RepID=UPI0028EECB3A|nr:porin [Bradyrhizobium prioritasuperba]